MNVPFACEGDRLRRLNERKTENGRGRDREPTDWKLASERVSKGERTKESEKRERIDKRKREKRTKRNTREAIFSWIFSWIDEKGGENERKKERKKGEREKRLRTMPMLNAKCFNYERVFVASNILHCRSGLFHRWYFVRFLWIQGARWTIFRDRNARFYASWKAECLLRGEDERSACEYAHGVSLCEAKRSVWRPSGPKEQGSLNEKKF